MKTKQYSEQHAAQDDGQVKRKVRARDLMTTDVNFVKPTESVLDVAKKLSEFDVGALPVCQDGRIVGMITDRDIVVRILAEEQSIDGAVRDAMSEQVICAYDDDDIATLVQAMQENEVRRIPVINHDEELVGIVALADLARSNVSADLKVRGLAGVS